MNLEHVKDWLDVEIQEAIEIQQELNNKAKETDYSDFDGEIARLEQDGFVLALQHVRRHL